MQYMHVFSSVRVVCTLVVANLYHIRTYTVEIIKSLHILTLEGPEDF